MTNSAARTTKDGRFGFEAKGDPSMPALVFLHGVGGAARGWRAQLDAFGDRYFTVAWDMPGYGGSAALPVVSIKTLSDALHDFLQQIGAQNICLVGHSIGGMIVQQYLVDHPHGATSVVLAQTSPAFGRADGDFQKQFIDARIGPLDRGETMASMAPGMVRDLIGDNPDPAGVALALDCMSSVKPETYRASMMALLGFDLRANLKNIAVPTMLLSGTRDNNSPAPMVKKTATFIPGSVYTELEGIGHLPNLENPAVFKAAIDAFLQGLPAISGAAS